MITVGNVMQKNVKKVREDASFKDVWKLLFKEKINAVPVVNAKGIPVGIITKEDMLRAFYPDYSEYMADITKADDLVDLDIELKDILTLEAHMIMCRNVICAEKGTSIMRVLGRMIARRVNQLPVLSENKRVIGIVTKGDIFNALYRCHKNLFRIHCRYRNK